MGGGNSALGKFHNNTLGRLGDWTDPLGLFKGPDTSAQDAAARAERERQERIEAKKRAKEALKNGEKVEDTTYLSDKEKIKEARRRYAEKYGDEYIDD